MKYFFLLPFIISVFQLSGQKHSMSFTLTGKVDGLDSGYIYLRYQLNDGTGVFDSCLITNQGIAFSGKIQEPTMAVLSTSNIGGYQRYDESNNAEFYIEPNSKMRFSAKYSHLNKLILTGSIIDADRAKLDKKREPITKRIEYLSNEIDNYVIEYRNKSTIGANKTELDDLLKKQDSLRLEEAPLFKKIRNIDSLFILDNPHSYVAEFMLYKYNVRSTFSIKFNSLEQLYNRLPKQLQRYYIGKEIKKKVEQQNLSKLKDAINFIGINAKGDTIELSSFTNKKYVLLDFGASWCIPCRQVIQSLKKVYSKYQNRGLEIISISVEKNKADWLKSIQEDSTAWINILEKEIFPTKHSTKSISEKYYISTIPALFLINNKSKVIGTYGGGDRGMSELKEKLKTIFDN